MLPVHIIYEAATEPLLTFCSQSIHTLRGHTSTVRCLKMSSPTLAISGSRDTTLRVWDIQTGLCTKVLVGHLASVRCLEIHGDTVVSGSYDTTAKIWSISEGRCLRTLNGHFSQIYAVAFDGKRVATGSLDTSVRIWNAGTGVCEAILQGHTSLVGQLQMRGNTLVTGGSDGSVRVWSLEKMAPVHRLAAHDNSVTSLQFDDNRVVSGGSDGRVKIWDLKTGALVRELSAPADAVWRVAFEEEKCVVLASRLSRTIMEVWSFSPPPEVEDEARMLEDRAAQLRERVGGSVNRPMSEPQVTTMTSSQVSSSIASSLVPHSASHPLAIPPASASNNEVDESMFQIDGTGEESIFPRLPPVWSSSEAQLAITAVDVEMADARDEGYDLAVDGRVLDADGMEVDDSVPKEEVEGEGEGSSGLTIR